jgi:hypothetical protein
MTSDTDKTKSSDFVFDPPLLPLDDNFALPPPIIQTHFSKKIMKKYYSYTAPDLDEKIWTYAEARCMNVHTGHRILISKKFKYKQHDIIVHDYIITKAKKSSCKKWTRHTVIYHKEERTPYNYDEYYFVPEEIKEDVSSDEDCNYSKESKNNFPALNKDSIQRLLALLDNM